MPRALQVRGVWAASGGGADLVSSELQQGDAEEVGAAVDAGGRSPGDEVGPAEEVAEAGVCGSGRRRAPHLRRLNLR